MKNIETRFVENFNYTLQQKGIGLVCAESMTGGLLASTICSVNGALSVLKGSVVAYSSDVKSRVLHVSTMLIDTYTAESAQVTEAMCKGLRLLYPYTELYIAVTGIAEKIPEDDTQEGQIYVAIWYKGTVFQYAEVLPAPERGRLPKCLPKIGCPVYHGEDPLYRHTTSGSGYGRSRNIRGCIRG